jgi:hypothetical protein
MTRSHFVTLCLLAIIVCSCARAAASSPPLDLQCGPDVNKDGVVNLFDLIIVASRYGLTVTGGMPPETPADTNGDGVICLSDLVCVSSNYGRNATPIPTRTPSPTATATPAPTATPTPDPDC